MSQSVIECRACRHMLAKRHHSGRVRICVGIPTTILPDGRVQLACPCGHRQVISSVPKAVKAA